MRRFVWIAVGVMLFSLGSLPAFGQDAEVSDTNRQALEGLLKELDQKIQEADRRMVAHPTFLNELRKLVQKYRGKLRKVFLSEDFRDGNYTRNPAWVVESGRFRVTSAFRLWSQIPVKPPEASTPSGEKTGAFGALLDDLIRSTTEKEQSEGSESPPPPRAFIRTRVSFTPAFEVDLTMVSKSQWGSMEIVLLGGKSLTARYRLVYQAAPSAQRPIQIIRERNGRSYIIESATRYPPLDNGLPHRIQWLRDPDGEMRVMVDGKEVLKTVEVFYRSKFSGLGLVNAGGTYEWGPIHILQAAKK